MNDAYTIDYARQLDQQDPLKEYRNEFIIDDPDLIYLDGNSLGRLPAKTADYLSDVICKEWGNRLIRSWNEGWYEKSRVLGNKIARIIGASADEVIIADSTSINLFKLAYAALNHQKSKTSIVSDTLNFPSDIYVFQGLVDLFGNKHQLELANSKDQITVTMHELESMIDNNTALVSLSHVAFKSAFMYDMHKVTSLAHEKGALMLWDLSHAVGAVPIKLNQCNVDLAVGCTYKYLNGGPGSPAFFYVRKDLQDKLESPVWAWFGEKEPFRFGLEYQPADGIRKFLSGTPPVISMSGIDQSLDMFIKAGMDEIRKKSLAQSEYLIKLAEEWLLPLGYSFGSPLESHQRGSHISLRHPEGYRICKAMIDNKTGGRPVIPDFREPDNIRLGITPLYTTFEEIFLAVEQMKLIVENGLHEQFAADKNSVT